MATETETKPEDQQTPTDDTAKQESSSSSNGKIEIGGDILTQEELRSRYETYKGKASAFDEASRRSAELTRENERWKQIAGDLQGAQRGDPEAVRRLGTYEELGIPREQIDLALKQLEGAEGAEGAQSEQGAKGRGRGKVGLDDLDEEVKAEVRESRAERFARIRAETHRNLHDFLDKDAVVGHYLTEEASAGFRKRAQTFAEGVLRGRAAEASRRGDHDWKPQKRDFEAVAQEVRKWAEDVLDGGARKESAGDAGGTIETGRPGIGRTPLTRSNSLHQQQEIPKRVKSTDKEYPANFRDRLLREQERVEREAQRGRR